MLVLFSVLMIVCLCLVCFDRGCCGCRGVSVFGAWALLLQQEPKTNGGIGGIMIFALFFRQASRQLRYLACSLMMLLLSFIYSHSRPSILQIILVVT